MSTLQQRIADDLRQQVTSGLLGPGERLPTEPELMAQYGVARNTVRTATARLINEGLIHRVPGRNGGMVVRQHVTLTFHASRAEMPAGLHSESDAFFTEVRAQGYEPSQVFSVHIEALSAELAERLEVDEGTTATKRRCVRYVNGEPNSIQDTYYPQWLTDKVPELMSPSDIAIGTTRLLTDRGYQQVSSVDLWTAKMPTPDVAALLDLPAGTPILEFIRVGLTGEQAVRLSVATWRGDRNQAKYTLGDHAALARAGEI